jgi:hypothetical protein
LYQIGSISMTESVVHFSGEGSPRDNRSFQRMIQTRIKAMVSGFRSIALDADRADLELRPIKPQLKGRARVHPSAGGSWRQSHR